MLLTAAGIARHLVELGYTLLPDASQHKNYNFRIKPCDTTELRLVMTEYLLANKQRMRLKTCSKHVKLIIIDL